MWQNLVPNKGQYTKRQDIVGVEKKRRQKKTCYTSMGEDRDKSLNGSGGCVESLCSPVEQTEDTSTGSPRDRLLQKVPVMCE